MFVLAYPWLLVLLPLPWLIRYGLPAQSLQRMAVRVPFGKRLSQALAGHASTGIPATPAFSLVIPTCLWLLVLVSLARPQWIEPPQVKELPTRDLLLLVDLSGSMEQDDFTSSSGKKVSRMAAVKEVLGDFLVRRDGDRVGLVVFGDAAYLQAPFSTDLNLSRQLLEECQVGMAGPRTALGDAIGLGVSLFDASDAPAKTMIALTDGNDTKSQVPPIEAARVAADRDIQIYTVAIGDPTTVGEDKLDEQALREVADAAGGSYYYAADRQQLEGIYEELDRIETRSVQTISHRPRRDLYFVFLAAGLLISIVDKAWAATRNAATKSSLAQRPTIHVNPVTGKLEVES